MSSIVSPQLEIFVPLQGLVDVGGEIVKMEKGAHLLSQRLAKLAEQMAGASYAKVPEATRKKNDEQKANDSEELRKLEASINNFKSVLTPAQRAQYLQDKADSFVAESAKLQASIDKMRAALPADVAKQPKKSLQKIAEAETELADVQKQLEQLKTKQ
jgi:chromosome segregation ATPase